MILNYSDTTNILEMFNSVEEVKKVQELLEEYEDNREMREKIIWTSGERSGRIPPVTFDFLRALVNMLKFVMEIEEMEGKR